MICQERAVRRAMGDGILVVDDVKQNLHLLGGLVAASAGFSRQFFARDGLEALQVLESEGSDIVIVLLDIMMPRLDGYEVARRLAATHKWPLGVVGCTVLDSREDRVKLFSCEGGNIIISCVAKPVDKSELMDRVTLLRCIVNMAREGYVDMALLHSWRAGWMRDRKP